MTDEQILDRMAQMIRVGFVNARESEKMRVKVTVPALTKEGFDRLLKVVQDTARERVMRLEGQTLEALVEEINEQDESLLTGRLSNNTIVHFKGDKSLIGKIVPVYLKECHGFYYLGEMR